MLASIIYFNPTSTSGSDGYINYKMSGGDSGGSGGGTGMWIPWLDTYYSNCAGSDWEDVSYLKRGLDDEDI